MTIVHHPDPSTLMSFAAGSLPEALAAVVAAHLSMCSRCRSGVRSMERIGGALLESVPSSTVATAALPPSPSDIHRHGPASQPHPLGEGGIPPPVSRLVGSDVDKLPWRRLGIGVWHVPLSLSKAAKGDLRLIKVAGGQAMPEHGHAASELTLVLRGAYSDATGCYRTGDLADLADEIEHKPIAGSQGCVCLIAADGRMRFKGLLPRLLQPLTGM